MEFGIAPRSPRWGYFFVVSAAVLWGVAGTPAKFLFNRGVGPFQLVQLRVTIAALCIFLWLLLKNRRLLKIARGDILYFAILGVFGIGASQFTYLYAVSKILVAAAAMLQYLAPIFIALYSIFVAREKMKKSTMAAIAMAVSGCYLVVGAYRMDAMSMNFAGIASGLGAALAFAFYSIYGEYGMRKYSPWTLLFFALLYSALLWNILYPPFRAFVQPYSLKEWSLILYIAVFGTVMPFGMFLEGVSLIRSARACVTGTLEPITAGAVAWMFLGEAMEPLQLAGALLVVAAVVLIQLKQEADEKAPANIRARRGREVELQKDAG